ncbi:MAG: hypothetical protein LBS88_13100 [Tannerellaceae bacterium]|nr:hypothetical protein [Tannerellaceae bacterium]
MSENGFISDIYFGQKKNSQVIAFTRPEGCRQISECHYLSKKGKIEFERIFEDSAGNSCKLTERFISSPGSVVWEIEIQGNGSPWTTPIETVVHYPVTEHSAYWTTWPAMGKNDGEWRDPLCIKPFEDLKLSYGGTEILNPNSIVIPMISIFEKDQNKGFTILQSPQDTILDLRLLTDQSGHIVFKRENHKISKDNVIHFRMHIYPHIADWRGGLDFCTKTYPRYFNPVSARTDTVAGCGAYSSWEGEPDTAKLNKMGFSFNWKATFDFPYMGMFLPEVPAHERWERYHQGGVKVGNGYTSVDDIERYMKRMKDMGYHVLCYFNLTEAGNNIVYPAPRRKAKEDKDLWRTPNDFVYYTNVCKALLKRYGAENDSPVYSNWEDCVVVDPGEENYKTHLLTQARRHIDYLPSSSGLCIDRLDWLREYNIKGDDGISWKDNVPSRSLLISWKEIMKELGPVIHKSGRVIFANVLTPRIDILEHIDAVYDEYGHIPLSLNRSAFMTLRKPLIAWTSSANDFKPDPDHYFQRHLYLGAFLTVPYPGNDHTILPNPETEKYYIDYGTMLKALKGKKWVLKPDVLKINKGEAKANIFENEESYQVIIALGQDERSSVSLTGLDSDYSVCKILYPGEENGVSVRPASINREMATFDIPLKRGCAMLIIDKN